MGAACSTVSSEPKTRKKAWPLSSTSVRPIGRASKMARVAFIGLGNMGSGMAANLAKAGHDARAFDLSAEALERAKKAGCLPAGPTHAPVEHAEPVVPKPPAAKQDRYV